MRRILLLTAILAMTILASAQVKEQPSGELRTYKRSGFAYMLDGGTPTKATQEGLVIDLVFDADGKTVWMKDVLAYMEYGTWVKASIEGNKLVLPMGQVLHRLNSINANLRLAVMDFDGDSYVADNSISEVTFTIDGDSFALDDMNENHILSAYWDDDLSWVRVGDWQTVYSPFDEIPVVVPEGLETVSMPFFAYTSKKEIDDNLQLGFDNNDCYIKGICPFVPNGWVKGSLNGTTMTIPTGQYIGKYNNIPLYLCGSNSGNDLTDIVFNYDEENNLYTLVTRYIVVNGYKNQMGYIDLFTDMTIGERHWETAVPAPAVIEQFFEKDETMDAMLFFRPSYYDVNDNPLRLKNTFYQIYSDINGKEEIVTFDKSLYNIDENLTDIPYNYSDGGYYFGYLDYLDMHVATFLMDISQWSRIGVRMGYTANNETNYSETVWTDLPNAIDDTTVSGNIISRQYYDLQGRRVSSLSRGFVIEVATLSDGTTVTTKKNL